ncbi:aldo/keto reductase [Propylenella binzhouense]|uniref:Aldo/keto reductase n=1 Tax=Propylenella binzhouense TaxID=2555902 RepID=A0A964T3F5_9HYPH|nr:aldo/keto reductase [Propylenella binzhouense]MYZ47589.1 aldo/keto reductase [Propylenella binzhouense]
MLTRRLGTAGPEVSAIGLGCLGLTSGYGAPAEADALATLDRAIARGVTLFDTSDAYGSGRNEAFLGGALAGRRAGLVIATKFGNLRNAGGGPGGVNGRPDYVPQACDASLRRLGIETIDLYYQHRVDPAVPIEETVGAMARLVEAGKVRFLGLCEAGPDTIRRAHAVHPLSAVQTEYSLWSRDAEAEILPLLAELGIALVAYSPLGRGFLAGALKDPAELAPGDMRRLHPRFEAGNFARNRRLLAPLEALAEAHGAAPASIALAWVLQRSPGIVPIPGTHRVAHLEANLRALEIELTPGECALLEAAFMPGSAAGLRYPPALLAMLGL